MTISGGRTKQLDIFCRVTGFTSDFLRFIVVELIRFFHGSRFSQGRPRLLMRDLFAVADIVLFGFERRKTKMASIDFTF